MIRDILDVASPRMRPPWSPQPGKPMTGDETAVLMLALRPSAKLYKAAFRVFGERAYYVLKSLERQGAIEHVGYNDWRITEKGRIAAALAMAKDPELAAVFAEEPTS